MSKLVKINNRYIRADKIKEIVVWKDFYGQIFERHQWSVVYLEEDCDNKHCIIKSFDTQEEAEDCAAYYVEIINEAV